MEKKKDQDIHLLYRTASYIIMALFVLLALSAGAHFLGVDGYLLGIDGMNPFDLLLSQVANTLIVLSLTPVLSENFGQIYWEDIKQLKLAERCLDIITSNYWEDTTYAGGGILAAADVEAMETVEAFTYSYTSQEEQAYLDRILKRDENAGVLPPQWKEYLRKMPHTTVYTQAAMEKSWEKLDAAEGADSTPAP